MKTRQIIFTVKAVLALVGGWLGSLVGGWDRTMTTLTLFIVADILSGWIRAIIKHRLSSKRSYRGTLRKVLIYVMVAVGAQVDCMLDTNLVRDAVISFYCIAEALSVVENVTAAGVPVPSIIRRVLEENNTKKFDKRG